MSDIDEAKLESVERNLGIKCLRGNDKLAEWSDAIILAVKPGIVLSVLKEISPAVNAEKLLISIAAGVRIGSIERNIGQGVPVVRAMPNTPALINQAATAIAPGSFATREHVERAHTILSAVGIVVAVDESMMDAVTALSGSGPAYLFLMTEIMEDAGRKLNLAPEIVKRLVRQTVLGSAKMVAEEGADVEALRRKVTSPGGTTEAALGFLKKAGFRETFIKAICEAARRSEELGV
jgi:pyrroline-5-carboxylate reductase